jgi:uridine kinase
MNDRVTLLIDGRSGSGKSQLATEIAAAVPAVQVVRLDDIYPGWDGLEAGSAHVHEFVIPVHRWRRWDWGSDAPAQWNELDPTRPLVIEGCGALSRANRALADFALWVDFDAHQRKERALAREPVFAEHWDAWAAQEQAFIDREHPRDLADAVVDGANVSDQVERWIALLRSA